MLDIYVFAKEGRLWQSLFIDETTTFYFTLQQAQDDSKIRGDEY